MVFMFPLILSELLDVARIPRKQFWRICLKNSWGFVGTQNFLTCSTFVFCAWEPPVIYLHYCDFHTNLCTKNLKTILFINYLQSNFFLIVKCRRFSSYLLSCVQNFPSTGKCEYFFPFCNFLCSSSIHARFPKIMTNQTLILCSVKITNLLFKHIVSERWFEICKLLCNP